MKHNVLTVRKIEAINKPGYVCDGMGLWLQTSAYGTKSWVFRYTINQGPLIAISSPYARHGQSTMLPEHTMT